MRRPVNLSAAYDYRLRTIDALKSAIAGSPRIEAFESAISSLRLAADNFGDERARRRYAGFATLLDALLLLVRWAGAVRGAEVDADRYLRAARQRATDLLSDQMEAVDDDPLRNAARAVNSVGAITEVSTIARLLLGVPLPLPLYVEEPVVRRRPVDDVALPPRRAVSVAFLSFTLYDVPFSSPQVVKPQLLHDLSVEVRVSQWPEAAETLVLDVASVEPPSAYEFPSFTFTKPVGPGPYLLRATGRMALRMPQAPLSRPLEFAYRARFVPAVEGIDVRVEGQRRLLVQSYDSDRQPLTGYVQIDPIIIAIRAQARAVPGIRDKELEDFLRILVALGNVAGQALQGNVFTGIYDESAFQKSLRSLLRQRADIGSELEEHPHAAGGVTDLSFRGIRLELKVVTDEPVGVRDIDGFLPQTTAYASGSDRRFGVLVVLDSSPKSEPSGSAANDIFLRELYPPTGGSLPVLIGVVIIRGNLPKPSSLN